MKRTFFGLIIYFSVFNLSAQNTWEETHEKFDQYIKKSNVELRYNAYGAATKKNDDYREALIYRNQYGWCLNKIEELKIDIPALLEIPEFADEGAYGNAFSAQSFHVSEWDRFYQMSKELLDYFEPKSDAYREVLLVKMELGFLLKEDEQQLIDLTILLTLISNKSGYSGLLWQYGYTLFSLKKYDEGFEFMKEAYEETSEFQFLQSIVFHYSDQEKYDSVLVWEDEIVQDESGVLLFYLAKSYAAKSEIEKAKNYFEDFIGHFVYGVNEYDSFVKIISGNVHHTIHPTQFEVLGDFFAPIKTKSACEYYNMGIRVLSEQNENWLANERIIAIRDEQKRQAVIDEMKKNEDDLKALDERLRTKIESLKGCKCTMCD